MRGGDLDDRIPPRLMFVFEDCVATRGKKRPLLNPKRSAELRHWTPNPTVTKRMWDIVQRHDFRIDMLTLLGPEWEDDLHHWVDKHDLPVSHVFATDAEGLPDLLNARVHTQRVYFGSPDHSFFFGHRGHQIPTDRDWEPLA